MANYFFFLFLLGTMVYGFSHPTTNDRHNKRSDILVHDVVQQKVAEKGERMKILKEFQALKIQLDKVTRKLKEVKQASMAEVKKTENSFNQRIKLLHNEVTVLKNETSSFRKVAFTAKLEDYPTTSTVIIFKPVITNIGGGYNNRDGIFYCPKAGLYMFSASLMSCEKHWVDGFIMKNNVKTARLHENIGARNNYFPSATTSVMLRLVIGDKVWVKGTGIRYYGGGTCTFSGILITN